MQNYIWAGWLGLGWEGWSVCMHRSNGIELGSGFVLLFMDSDVCILAFFLSLTLLELAEENK